MLRRRDDGFSLVELSVAMMVFGIFATAVATMTMSMMQVATRTRSIADASTKARAVLDQISRTLPSASQVNQPTQVGSDWYVEASFPPAAGAGTSSCAQWRLLAATDQLQVRTWNTVNPSASAWRTLADHVTNDPSTQRPFTVLAPDSGFSDYRVTIDIYLGTTDGGKAHNRTDFTLRNSGTVTLGTSVCTEVGRP
jgi:prepilin-type N-terminal cleavage/methylation domain-containing protein